MTTKKNKASPKQKAKSREYLESALEQARKMLPGWMFAVIHQAALPSSGGRAARNRRMSVTEKLWIEGLNVEVLSNAELGAVLKQLTAAQEASKRKGLDCNPVSRRLRDVAKEMKERGVNEAIASIVIKGDEEDLPKFLPDGVKVKKGFTSGEPEGGMHAHGLDRRNSKTMDDGGHIHMFVLPGSGEIFITDEDGRHEHEIEDNGNSTMGDGRHSHSIWLADGTGIETKLGGDHAHELMVDSTGFSGLHRHTLKLADGTEIESITPGEYVARFRDPNYLFARPIHSSREVADALNEARRLRDRMFGPDLEMPVAGDAVAMMAKGEELELPLTLWEVRKLAEGGAYCGLDDMDDPMLMSNPHNHKLEPGDIVEVSSDGEIAKHSRSSLPHTVDQASSIATRTQEIEKATRSVSFVGPQNAVLVFVSASPSPLELARKEALAGLDGALFQERYLAPMGLTKSDVATGFAVPVSCNPTSVEIDLWREQLVKSLSIYSRAKVVALGRVAKEALGPLVAYSLPHPAAVRRHGDRGEVDRKIRSICKALDISVSASETLASSSDEPSDGESGATLADSISELSKGQGLRVAVTKSVSEKQIVYGVILDPYQVDLHNDWLPPAEIESTAHDFLAKSRIIGLSHNGVADAEIVESWVEVYPTEKDRELALQNLPHKAYRRKFGSDTIHSGAWVAGVKLSDELWAAHKKGDLDAFSIGGFSFKTQVSAEAMPDVEFLDLQP